MSPEPSEETMFEDLREDTEGTPVDQETEWSDSPLAIVARLAVLAGMALAIAVSVSEMLGSDPKITPILESSSR
jgi:hypothetical protein